MPINYGELLYCTIYGRVVDGNDNPLEGIEIQWDITKTGNHFKTLATTNSDGKYGKKPGDEEGDSVKVAPIPENESEQLFRAYDSTNQAKHQKSVYVSVYQTVEINFVIIYS